MIWLSLCFLACDDPGETTAGLFTTVTTQTSEQGIAKVSLDATGTSALVTMTAPGNRLALETLTDPAGNVVLNYQDWIESDQSLTWAFYAMGDDLVFSWPIRGIDGSLDPGTWTLGVATLDDDFFFMSGIETTATLQQKQDADLTRGRLSVTLAYANDLDRDASLVTAVEEGVLVWQDLWAAYGLDVDVRYVATSIDPSLDNPFDGNATYETLSGSGTDADIHILIGETIGGDPDLLGHSGSIPNSLVSTPRATLVISWLAAAGPDAQFDDAEILLLGETLAHEAGHYAGLFHPVETTWDRFDALSDTPSCSSESGCETSLGDNLMFPYPLCSFSGDCMRQTTVTANQETVMQQYTGML